MRPRILDLFAGAGGSAVGYNRAGFDVVGVDIAPQPHYPYEFHQGDAIAFLAEHGHEFDAIHASPPCQAYTALRTLSDRKHPELVEPVRDLLRAWGGPYVIENVPGAPLLNPLTLCGASFGLGAMCRDGIWRPLRRHRLFESNVWMMGGGCACSGQQPIGVYGHGGGGSMLRGYKGTVAESRTALGCEWMTRREVSQAIPPAYTEWIGRQLLAAIEAAA